MRALSLKGFTLAGLVMAATPGLIAQKAPFGITADTHTPAVRAVRGGGAEASALKGAYALSFSGALVGANIFSRQAGEIGSIIANGKGQIIGGEIDFTSVQNTLMSLPVTGTYILNADGTGALTLVTSQFTQSFSLFAAEVNGKVTSATVVQTDGAAGTSGSLVKQKAAGAPAGNFSFNLSGETFETSGTPNAVAVSGTLDIIDGFVVGAAGFFVGDASHGAAAVIPPQGFPASVSTPDAYGRFTLSISFSSLAGEALPPVTFAAYTVDATHFTLLPITAPSENVPLLIGFAVQ